MDGSRQSRRAAIAASPRRYCRGCRAVLMAFLSCKLLGRISIYHVCGLPPTALMAVYRRGWSMVDKLHEICSRKTGDVAAGAGRHLGNIELRCPESFIVCCFYILFLCLFSYFSLRSIHLILLFVHALCSFWIFSYI